MNDAAIGAATGAPGGLVPGPLRFARFAYPPNELGYCGPDRGRALLEYAHAAVSDGGLRELAGHFEGAWPYLELIAHANGIADPLDSRVVEAYWIGNALLGRVEDFARSLAERFAPVDRAASDAVAAAAASGGRPHHGFHVFVVYPWVGLLRTGARDQALHVLDRCRVRWGRVVDVGTDTATVESQPLLWDGSELRLGPVRPETVTASEDGYRLHPIAAGDLVALHWDWVCEPLSTASLATLRRETAAQLDLVNRRLAVSPPAMLLG